MDELKVFLVFTKVRDGDNVWTQTDLVVTTDKLIDDVATEIAINYNTYSFDKKISKQVREGDLDFRDAWEEAGQIYCAEPNGYQELDGMTLSGYTKSGLKRNKLFNISVSIEEETSHGR